MAELNVADLSPTQREVWQAEQDYWVLTKNKDVEGFLALAHDRVAVWPAGATLPIDRARLRDTQRTRGERDGLTDFELTFHSIQVYGEAAVVYYTVVTTGTPYGGAPVLRVARSLPILGSRTRANGSSRVACHGASEALTRDHAPILARDLAASAFNLMRDMGWRRIFCSAAIGGRRSHGRKCPSRICFCR